MAVSERKAGVILSYINIFLGSAISLFFTPFLLRYLGQSEFGLFSLASTIIGYLAILDLGFGNAIVVFTSKYIANNKKGDERKLQGTVFFIYLCMSAMVVVIGAILVLNTDIFFQNSMSAVEIDKIRIMLIILTINLAITFPFSIYTSILNAYEKFIFIKIIGIFRVLVAPILIVPVLIIGYKSISIVIVYSVINLICLIAGFIYCKKQIGAKFSPFDFNKKTFKELFAYSFFIFLGMIVDQVNWNVDNFILGIVKGSTEVSIYAVASIINGLFITLSITISGVMLPKISKMVSQSATNSELTDELIKVGRLQLYVIFFIGSLIVFFGHQFISIWAGVGYEKSYIIALILILPVSIPLVQNLGISILQAKNMFKFRAIAAFCMTFVNIAISIPLAKIYGGIGAAIGTAISLVVLNIFIMNFYYHLKVGLNMVKFWKSIIQILIYFIPPCILAVVLVRYLKFDSAILEMVLGGVIYSISFLFMAKFAMNSYEKAILNSFLMKLKFF